MSVVRKAPENVRQQLIDSAVELFRRHGFVATTVDQICTAAGVTKGAFFHHFPSKEALAEATLEQWKAYMANAYATGPFQAIDDPVQKLTGCMEFFVAMLSDPRVLTSCLAGTIAQEVSESHERLRAGAQECFACGAAHFREIVDEAARATGADVDAASLADLWMATIQGSVLLAKTARDPAIIAANLRHAQRYIESCVGTVPPAQK
jgi:TetR/AcrR family transcriptional repressor of nem operon